MIILYLKRKMHNLSDNSGEFKCDFMHRIIQNSYWSRYIEKLYRCFCFVVYSFLCYLEPIFFSNKAFKSSESANT